MWKEDYPMPRDPKRIKRILEVVRAAWEAHPDLRLSQLIMNTHDGVRDYSPLYYREDEVLEQGIKDLYLTKAKAVKSSESSA